MKTVNVFLFFYNLIWTAAVILSIPLAPFVKKWRYVNRIGTRLPFIRSKRKKVWVHALSVGEVISAIPLLRALKVQYPSKEIVFTVKTVQGMKIARAELEDEVDFLLPMPLDFWWSNRHIINSINPMIFVFIETDIWPGLVCTLKKKGVNILLANGRISPKTYGSYKRFSYIITRVFNLFDKCLMQSDLDRERLLKIGVSGGIVETVGNLKYDRSWSPLEEEERKYWIDELKIEPEERLWVAGSTHEGEEAIILKAFKRVNKIYPELRLIIAPRRIERSDEILKIGSEMDIDISLRTDMRKGFQVQVLNTLGELSRIYGLADISFVGGSLVPIGGHNLLEPASFGCPVIFGPHTQNFVLMAQTLEENGGGVRIDRDNMFDVVNGLLHDKVKLKRMGTKARDFVEMNKGALDRVMKHIGRYI